MRRAASAVLSLPGGYPGQELPVVPCGRPKGRLLALLGAVIVVAAVAVTTTAGPVAREHPPQIAASARLPVAAWGPVTRAVGRDDPAYRVARAGGPFVARNPRHKLDAQFSPAGVTVHSGALLLGMSLRGYGYGNTLIAVGAIAPTARANRVLYRDGSLVEWYANGPVGLEQGFTLAARPAGDRVGPLTLALALSGNARGQLLPQRGTVTFSHASGSLSYGGLVATDARGRTLPAWVQLRHGELLLRVDDKRARYPLSVDPFVQQAELTASDFGGSGSGQAFLGTGLGGSVAISGDTIVVGASGASVNGNTYQGAVYVFVKPKGGWANATETARLTASDGAPNEFLGGGGYFNETGVGISGGTVVAGAEAAAVNGNGGQGAVYVWAKPKGGWRSETQAAKLTASDGAGGDNLGSSVSIFGGTVVAGAVRATVNGNAGQGAVYVFVRPNGGWANETQTAKLTASDGAKNDYLGSSMAIHGDVVVAGAPTGFQPSPGAVYVFVKPHGGWSNGTETAKLTASNGIGGEQVGWSVAIDAGTVVAGAPCARPNGVLCEGAAYVFLKPHGGWRSETEAAELTDDSTPPVFNANLGLGVAVSGQTVVAGAGFEGAALVFAEPAGGWESETETAKLTAADSGFGFGWSIAMSGQTVVVGATFAGHATGGSAYVFGDGGSSFGSAANNRAVARASGGLGLRPSLCARSVAGERALLPSTLSSRLLTRPWC